jgi:hypothetical protein
MLDPKERQIFKDAAEKHFDKVENKLGNMHFYVESEARRLLGWLASECGREIEKNSGKVPDDIWKILKTEFMQKLGVANLRLRNPYGVAWNGRASFENPDTTNGGKYTLEDWQTEVHVASENLLAECKKIAKKYVELRSQRLAGDKSIKSFFAAV